MGLARLIFYLEHSPAGSLIVRDFRHNQFVLVSGEIKLTDLDDLDNEERACVSSEQCIVGTRTVNWTALPCVSGKCLGFNAAFNMFNIRRYFLDHILVPEAPGKVRTDLQDILIQAHNPQWNTRLLVKHLEDVVRRLRTGNHVTFGRYKISLLSLLYELTHLFKAGIHEKTLLARKKVPHSLFLFSATTNTMFFRKNAFLHGVH